MTATKPRAKSTPAPANPAVTPITSTKSKPRGVVCLDPGHGGSDPGAVGGGLTEAAYVLSLSKTLGEALDGAGFDVVYTRSKDVDVELEPRCRVSNEAGANLFVSLHVNAALNPGATGFEVYHNYGSVRGLRCARLIDNAVKANGDWPLVSRGVKDAGFFVLRFTDAPAVLVETCFISNPTDVAKVLNSSKATAALVESLVEAITEWFEPKQ